jgi:hypothetical protein
MRSIERTRRLSAAAVTATLVAGALAACGSGGSSGSGGSDRTPTVTATLKPHPAAGARLPHVAYLGATQHVRAGSSTLSVTVSHVIDPLRASGAALLPASRAVGVLVRIHNSGPGIYDSSATGDVSVVPSTGAATPVYAVRGPCETPLRDFDNYIAPDESREGCVAFVVPAAARLLAVRFSPHARVAGRATWVLPH